MKYADIPPIRLRNQRLLGTSFTNPTEVVEWLGAVQSQDYAGAKWALGLRLRGVTESDIDAAFDAGDILRTHVMRPTWHFVSPRDILWMLKLTAPRVLAASAYYLRKLELDPHTLSRSHDIMANALKGGQYLTRAEIVQVLQEGGIRTVSHDNLLRFTYIVMHAELAGIMCSGPRRGKQFTYALLEERAPRARSLSREESLAELTRRYFSSHGPALIKDFVWWSGLTVADAKVGMALVSSTLAQETVNGSTYWFVDTQPAVDGGGTFLLSNYDEYTVAYRDHDAVFDPSHKEGLTTLFPHTVIIDGQVAGSWRREFKRDEVIVTLRMFNKPTGDQLMKIRQAAERYGTFLGKKLTVLQG